MIQTGESPHLKVQNLELVESRKDGLQVWRAMHMGLLATGPVDTDLLDVVTLLERNIEQWVYKRMVVLLENTKGSRRVLPDKVAQGCQLLLRYGCSLFTSIDSERMIELEKDVRAEGHMECLRDESSTVSLERAEVVGNAMDELGDEQDLGVRLYGCWDGHYGLCVRYEGFVGIKQRERSNGLIYF